MISRVLFFEITSIDRPARDWVGSLFGFKRKGAPAGPFDLRWLRWTTTFSAVLTPLLLFRAGTVPHDVGGGAAIAFGLQLCIYFAAILFHRLQCSLLELCIVIAVLGNIEGLLLTTPGLTVTWWLLPVLGLSVAAWTLHALAVSMAQARILQRNTGASRAALLLQNLLAGAGPALLVAGLIVTFGTGTWISFGPKSGVKYPLVGFGLIGVLIGIRLRLATVRAAKVVEANTQDAETLAPSVA